MIDRVCCAVLLWLATSCLGAEYEAFTDGVNTPPPAMLHPAFDVTRMATTPDALAGPRAFLTDALRNRRKLETVLAPWTTPCPKLKGSWVRWLTPAGAAVQVLYSGLQLRLPEADQATQLAAALSECSQTLNLEAYLVAQGRADWLNPLASATGNKALLEGLRYVLAVDETTFVQTAAPPAVAVTEKKRDLWTGLIGGPKTATDYMASVKVRFPLRDAAGAPVVTDRTKSLALVLVGQAGDVDRVPLDLGKLPASLPVPPAQAPATPR